MLAKGTAPAKEFEIAFPGATLAELRAELEKRYGGVFAQDIPLLGFRNGKAVGRDWQQVPLSEGDTLMFVAPIGGG